MISGEDSNPRRRRRPANGTPPPRPSCEHTVKVQPPPASDTIHKANLPQFPRARSPAETEHSDERRSGCGGTMGGGGYGQSRGEFLLFPRTAVHSRTAVTSPPDSRPLTSPPVTPRLCHSRASWFVFYSRCIRALFTSSAPYKPRHRTNHREKRGQTTCVPGKTHKRETRDERNASKADRMHPTDLGLRRYRSSAARAS